MQAQVTLNVQQSIRPGHMADTYYPTSENSCLQASATVNDNRFFVALPSLNSGSSSTVTFNPNEGLAEVIITMRLSDPGAGNRVGLALQEGWGYTMLRRIGYRYGSSQLYYITGAQNLVQALSLCEDSGKKQQLYYLGGQALLSDADWADAGKRTCYVYLRLPHSSPALSGGALPFPSDVLTAPIQLQIDLANFSQVISKVPSSAGVIPTQLEFATVNFTQVTMQDAGDLVARRFDMSKHALTIPLGDGWTQEEIQIPVVVGANGQFQVSLTGCKAGDLRKLRVWVTAQADETPNVTTGLISLNKFVTPTQLTFAINGLIYLDSANGSWQLTNLLRRRQPPVITYSDLTAPVPPSASWTATPYASAWVEIDLAQPSTLGDSQEVELVHGVPVMNSVMNLTGILPVGPAAYTIHCEYVLNCSWMASRGSAEFVF
jgi:hypothetical protein